MATNNTIKLAEDVLSAVKHFKGELTAEGCRQALGKSYNSYSGLESGGYQCSPRGVKLSPRGEDFMDLTWSKFIKFCRENGLIKERAAQCVTGQNVSGQCGAAAYCNEPYECCAQCHKDCNSRCELVAVKEESAPCNPEPARNAAAAVTAAAPAATPTAETSTISVSAADAAASIHKLSSESTQASPSAPCSPVDCGTAAPLACADSASATATAGFDYSGLDLPTVDTLHLAERMISDARRDYVTKLAQAVYIAHDALCGGVVANCDNSKHGHRGEDAFRNWCASVGLGKDTAYRLLQVAGLLNGATPEEQAVLEAASPSLLYAAAKPSAPAQLVQGVKDGDITTHKQYQELLAQLKAKEEELAAEQASRKSENAAFSELLADEQQRRQAANEARIAAEKTAQEAKESCRAAQNSLAEARDELRTKTARVKELEARPIEVKGADPDDIARWRAEGAKQAQAQLDKAQAEAAALRGRLEEQDRHAGAHAVALSEQVAASVETILQGHFEELDALPYDTFEKAVAPFVTLLNHLTTALNLGRWPEAD